MSDSVDQEVEAIKAIMTALTPLSEKARASVFEYVVRRLSIPQLAASPLAPPAAEGARTPSSSGLPSTASSMHIKQFKEEKGPRSANEMAAVAAYYLANVAPPAERKTTINQKSIETSFKIAGFPLPRHVRQTLPNAKSAGYFDLVGDGEYRLNAVGHNLVAHSMPRGQVKKSRMRSPRQGRAKDKPTPGRRKRSK